LLANVKNLEVSHPNKVANTLKLFIKFDPLQIKKKRPGLILKAAEEGGFIKAWGYLIKWLPFAI
jgi:hypothetical protein